MGFFNRIRHFASHIVHKAKRFVSPLIKKAKAVYHKAGKIGGFIHRKVVPKLRLALLAASATGVLDEFSLPALAALEVGDKVLGRALQAKSHIDRAAGRMQSYGSRIGKYSKRFSSELKHGNYTAAVKTGARFTKEIKTDVLNERSHFQAAMAHF